MFSFYRRPTATVMYPQQQYYFRRPVSVYDRWADISPSCCGHDDEDYYDYSNPRYSRYAVQNDNNIRSPTVLESVLSDLLGLEDYRDEEYEKQLEKARKQREQQVKEWRDGQNRQLAIIAKKREEAEKQRQIELKKSFPSFSVTESDDKKSLSLNVSVPQLSPKDFSVSVSGDMISVSGERKVEEKSDNENGCCKYMYSFRRSWRLPSGVDVSTVKAVGNEDDNSLSISFEKPVVELEKEKDQFKSIDVVISGSDSGSDDEKKEEGKKEILAEEVSQPEHEPDDDDDDEAKIEDVNDE